MAIFMVQSRFWNPREAAGVLWQAVMDQLCAGCPISVGGEPPSVPAILQFIGDDFEIVDALEYADLTIVGTNMVLNDEAGPAYCDGHLQGPSLGVDGEWTIILDQVEQTFGAANTVYGAVITNGGGLMWGVSKFDVPVVLGGGDTIKHTGLWSLLPQIPPPP